MVINSKTKLSITALGFLCALGLIIWEYFNGGVVSHYFLQDNTMPELSNWWSLLSIPMATWLALTIAEKRQPEAKLNIMLLTVGLLFGVILTALFYFAPQFIVFILLGSFALALFLPLYLPEFYIGFIVSMLLGFGGVIPVVFGLLFITIYAIEYKLIRRSALYLLKKI